MFYNKDQIVFLAITLIGILAYFLAILPIHPIAKILIFAILFL